MCLAPYAIDLCVIQSSVCDYLLSIKYRLLSESEKKGKISLYFVFNAMLFLSIETLVSQDVWYSTTFHWFLSQVVQSADGERNRTKGDKTKSRKIPYVAIVSEFREGFWINERIKNLLPVDKYSLESAFFLMIVIISMIRFESIDSTLTTIINSCNELLMIILYYEKAIKWRWWWISKCYAEYRIIFFRAFIVKGNRVCKFPWKTTFRKRWMKRI